MSGAPPSDPSRRTWRKVEAPYAGGFFAGFMLGTSVDACAVFVVFIVLSSVDMRNKAFAIAGSTVGIYQFAYLWPWWRSARRRRLAAFSGGLKAAAASALLFSGGCWTLDNALQHL